MEIAVAARAGRPGFLNRRTVLGVLLVGLSVAGGYEILGAAEETVPVWVAARDLASGSPITAGALRVEHVSLPDRLGSEYVTTAQKLEGSVVTRPLGEGELIPHEWVAPSGISEGRSITVPIDPEHAVGGELRPGDVVDLYATFDPSDVRARTVSLVREAEVIDTVSAGGLVMGDRSIIGLTVSVSPDEAQRIAFASRTAQVDVVRIDDPSERGSRSVITGADF